MRPLQRRLALVVCAWAIALGSAACTSGTPDAGVSSTSTDALSGSVIDTTGVPSAAESATQAVTSSALLPTPSVIDVPTPTPIPSASSPALDPAAQEAADRAAVEQAWAQFWAMSDSLSKVPESQRTARAATASIEPTLSQVVSQASQLEADGLEVYGESVFHPYWEVAINGGNNAVMGDCTDTSQSGARLVSSGEIKTVGVTKNNTRATFTRGADGIWRVREIFFLLDISC